MYSKCLIAGLLLMAAACGLDAHPAPTDVPTTCLVRSSALLQHLESGDFTAATDHFDDRMQASLSASQLEQVWRRMLPVKVGAFVSAEAPHASADKGRQRVETPLHFAHGTLVMQVACQADGSVSGLFFAPAAEPPAAPATDLPGGMHEEALAVPTPLGPLPGILTLPEGKGPFPAAVLVPGSGPQDRDETIGPNKPLRDLARGLAESGIASLRFDKRSLTYREQLAGRPVSIDDVVTDDALTALKTLRAAPRVDASRVFLVGHSIGALMAPRIALRDGHLAGAVLLSGPERLTLDVVIAQLRYLEGLGGDFASITKLIPGVVAARDTLARADPAHPPAGEFFHAPASFWLSLRDYDAIDTAKQLHTPILLQQGLADFQVPPDQGFRHWQAAFRGDSRVSLRSYPGLSHLFMPAGHPPSPADYGKPGHVDGRVIRDMATWMLTRPPVR